MLRYLLCLFLGHAACAPATWRRPPMVAGAGGGDRVFVTQRDTPVRHRFGHQSCSQFLQTEPSEIIEAGTTIVLRSWVPEWDVDGLQDGCRAQVALHVSSSGASLVSLDHLADPLAAGASLAGRTAVVFRSSVGLSGPLPTSVTVRRLADGQSVELSEGTELQIIGQSGRRNLGTVAQLADGTVVHGRIPHTEAEGSEQLRIQRDTCERIAGTLGEYAPLPGTAILADPSRSGQRFVLDLRTLAFEEVPLGGGPTRHYVAEDKTGHILLVSQAALPRHGLAIVRVTGNRRPVGTVEALELEVLFQQSPHPCVVHEALNAARDL